MFTRTNLLAGVTAAVVLIGGVAWAASAPPPSSSASGDVRTTDSTVIPIDGVGQVTFERIEAGLSVTSAIPVAGWTASIERPAGAAVEVRFESVDGGRVDVVAEVDSGGIRVDIRRALPEETSTSTTVVTSSTRPTTSSTAPDASTSTSAAGGGTTSTSLTGSTSTTIDDDATTSTSLDDSTTSTSLDDASSTSTSLDNESSTSTSLDDDGSTVPDGVRTFVVEGAATVTVDVRNGALVLLGIDVASGWTAEIDEQDSDEIRIEFEGSDDAEAELRVRVQNGNLEVETRRD